MNLQKIARIINPIKRTIGLIVGKGKVNVSHSHDLVQASFMEHETFENVPILHMYGLASRIPRGSKCVGICNGRRRNLMIIAADEKIPVKLAEEDVLLWHKGGNKIHLQKDKISFISGTKNLGEIIESLITALAKPCVDKSPLLDPQEISDLKLSIARFK